MTKNNYETNENSFGNLNLSRTRIKSDDSNPSSPNMVAVLLDGLTVGHPAGVALLPFQGSHPHLNLENKMTSRTCK